MQTTVSQSLMNIFLVSSLGACAGSISQSNENPPTPLLDAALPLDTASEDSMSPDIPVADVYQPHRVENSIRVEVLPDTNPAAFYPGSWGLFRVRVSQEAGSISVFESIRLVDQQPDDTLTQIRPLETDTLLFQARVRIPCEASASYVYRVQVMTSQKTLSEASYTIPITPFESRHVYPIRRDLTLCHEAPIDLAFTLDEASRGVYLDINRHELRGTWRTGEDPIVLNVDQAHEVSIANLGLTWGAIGVRDTDGLSLRTGFLISDGLRGALYIHHSRNIQISNLQVYSLGSRESHPLGCLMTFTDTNGLVIGQSTVSNSNFSNGALCLFMAQGMTDFSGNTFTDNQLTGIRIQSPQGRVRIGHGLYIRNSCDVLISNDSAENVVLAGINPWDINICRNP